MFNAAVVLLRNTRAVVLDLRERSSILKVYECKSYINTEAMRMNLRQCNLILNSTAR